MKLSQIKSLLPDLKEIIFKLEDGTPVPAHFHVTEVGSVNKHFIDCGGTIRHENTVSFQLWSADDADHRLQPSKLLNIIELSENRIGIQDAEIEVEYQTQTIGKYDLDFDGKCFILKNKMTDCLAPDKCGIPIEKPRVKLSEWIVQPKNTCTPGGGCC